MRIPYGYKQKVNMLKEEKRMLFHIRNSKFEIQHQSTIRIQSFHTANDVTCIVMCETVSPLQSSLALNHRHSETHIYCTVLDPRMGNLFFISLLFVAARS
jgi:hypothetical protein